MFKEDGPFNITPVVKVDRCIEFYTDSSDCKRSNGTLEYSFRLRCLARQIFPNGTVISESSQVKDLTVERLVDNITEDMKPMTEHQTGKTNVGASVITALIVILILVAIGIVCYAQRFKVIRNHLLQGFLKYRIKRVLRYLNIKRTIDIIEMVLCR